MSTCPNCWGREDLRNIQLEEIDVELSERLFYCKKCEQLFKFEEVDQEDMHDYYSEELIEETQSKIEQIKQDAKKGDKE